MITTRSMYIIAVRIVSFFFVAKYYAIVDTSHFFFMHSSVFEHFACFWILAFGSGAVVHVWVQVSFKIVVVFAGPLRKGTAGMCMATLFFPLKNSFILWSILALTVYTTGNIRRSLLIHLHSSIFCL